MDNQPERIPLPFALTLEFLWWFKLVAFFQGDALKDMQALGISDAIARSIIHTDAFALGDLITLWGDRPTPEYGDAILKYLDFFHTNYLSIISKQTLESR